MGGKFIVRSAFDLVLDFFSSDFADTFEGIFMNGLFCRGLTFFMLGESQTE